jgi:hypothetical protein
VVNHTKPVLLRTDGGDEFNENRHLALAGDGWNAIRFVAQSEILGITFGHELHPEEVWDEKTTRLELKAKIARYFSKLTPTKAVIYANVYLLPIISFVGQFYPVPHAMERRIRRALAKLILPQAPPVVNEQLLFAPYEYGGPPVRLRDFVLEANAAIIRNLSQLYAQVARMQGQGAPLQQSYDRHSLDPFRSVECVAKMCKVARVEVEKCLQNGDYSPVQKQLFESMTREVDEEKAATWISYVRKKIISRIEQSPWEAERVLLRDNKQSDLGLSYDKIFAYYEYNRRAVLADNYSIKRFVWRSQTHFLFGGAPTTAAREAHFQCAPKMPDAREDDDVILLNCGGLSKGFDGR